MISSMARAWGWLTAVSQESIAHLKVRGVASGIGRRSHSFLHHSPPPSPSSPFFSPSSAPSINIHNSMEKDYFPSASGLPSNGGLLLPPPPPYRPGSPALSELSTPYSSPAPSPVPSPSASPLHSPFYTPNHSPCSSPTPPLRASQPGTLQLYAI